MITAYSNPTRHPATTWVSTIPWLVYSTDRGTSYTYHYDHNNRLDEIYDDSDI